MQRRLIASVLLLVGSATIFAVPPGTDEEISARLEPFGNLCRAGDDCGAVASGPSGGAMTGQQVYDQFCFACHMAGVGGAPKLGAAEEWAARVDKGMDELMATTLNGLNAMPPKGTCMTCSDDELNAAVSYMLESLE